MGEKVTIVWILKIIKKNLYIEIKKYFDFALNDREWARNLKLIDMTRNYRKINGNVPTQEPCFKSNF